MKPTFMLKTYQEILHLIPSESFYHTHYNVEKHSKFIVIDGDYHFDKPIDLLYPDQYFGIDIDWDNDPLIAIIITSNATAGNIFCSEMNYGTGLIVLGNLTADNMVVSGQEIFVQGDLKVGGLFWGHYNHGSLVVKGEIHIKVFLETDYLYDEQRFKNKERTFISHKILFYEEDYQNYPNRLTAILRKDLCFQSKEEAKLKDKSEEVWSWWCWVDEKALFEHLENDERNLCKSDEAIKAELIQAENAEKLRLEQEKSFDINEYHQKVNKARFNEIWNNEKVWESYQNFMGHSPFANVRNGNYIALIKSNSAHSDRIIMLNLVGKDNILEFYIFEWNEDLGRVILLTQDGNGVEFEPYEVPFDNILFYKKATEYFYQLEDWLWLG